MHLLRGLFFVVLLVGVQSQAADSCFGHKYGQAQLDAAAQQSLSEVQVKMTDEDLTILAQSKLTGQTFQFIGDHPLKRGGAQYYCSTQLGENNPRGCVEVHMAGEGVSIKPARLAFEIVVDGAGRRFQSLGATMVHCANGLEPNAQKNCEASFFTLHLSHQNVDEIYVLNKADCSDTSETLAKN